MASSIFKNWVTDWRSYLGEFLGTFVFVFIASGVVLSDKFYGGIGIIGIALVIGLAYGVMVFVAAPISGGHINPAITLAFWLARVPSGGGFAQRISGLKAVTYIIFQILASLAAAGILFLIFGAGSMEFFLGGPALGIGITQQTGVVLEAILSAILVFVFFASMVGGKSRVKFAPMMVGAVVFISTVIAWPLTGAALNPARAIGPAVISGSYANLTVWIVGPVTGALFGIVYDLLFLRKIGKT